MVSFDEKVLADIVEAIVNEVSPERIILFGSRARGDDSLHSDVDLLVIESGPLVGEKNRRSESARIWKALARFEIPKDILVFSREEVERWKESLNHVIARALREGKTVYVRP